MSIVITRRSQENSPDPAPRFVGATTLQLARFRLSTLQEIRDQLWRMALQEKANSPTQSALSQAACRVQGAVGIQRARLARLEEAAPGAPVGWDPGMGT